MMTFCNKSAHSFLGLSNIKDNATLDLQSLLHHHHDRQNTATDGRKLVDILDYAVKKSPHFSPFFSTRFYMMTATKRDTVGLGFIDDVRGSVDGLMSCTESLGFESSDERRADDQIENLGVIELCWRKETMVGSRWKREHVKKEMKNFPPPLSSLDKNGKPTFFLRPVRRDGKLELQVVKIGRQEIMRASRQDGRLRLHLIKNEDEAIEEEFEEDDEEAEEEEELVEEEENTQEIQEDVQQMVEKITEEEEVEERVEGWQIPANPGGGGEGFRRCHEQVSLHQNHHHHHDDLHVWGQYCVIIR